ncbi:transcriptional regulator BetI [Rhizobium sp. LjRoot254]|uniref:transcriptional regulator BetI n=1 Tax=Rhizobium sp. LjRoot254 TaxID=3342297 RepID=UPI003ED103C2
MKLTRLSDIRRKELRRAAVIVMRREGAAGTTLEKVAIEAGASKGILLHYFRNKQELFEQAMREANLALRNRVAERMKRAETPFQRLWAVIDENLGENAYKAPNGHAWLSLCAEAPREPQLARIQKVIHARMHSNLMSGLVPLMGKPDAKRLALSLSALIDGLWVKLGIGDTTVSSRMALDMAYRFLEVSLPEEAMEVMPGASEKPA